MHLSRADSRRVTNGFFSEMVAVWVRYIQGSSRSWVKCGMSLLAFSSGNPTETFILRSNVSKAEQCLPPTLGRMSTRCASWSVVGTGKM